MIDTSLTSSNFFFLLAVFQGIILSFIICFKPKRNKPDLLFGILIFLFSLALLHLILEESIHAFNAKFPIPMDFGFAYGPLAYLHIRFIKSPSRIFKGRDFLHFVPSLLLDVLFFTVFFSYVDNHMDWAYKNIELIQTLSLVISLLGLLQLITYTYLMFKESRKIQFLPREFMKVQTWLRFLISTWSALTVFLILVIPVALIYIEKLDDNSEWIYKPLGVIFGLFIYLLGYLYLIKYSRVVHHYMNRMSKVTYSQAELIETKFQLLQAIKEQEYYKKHNLTLGKLAKETGLPIKKLSSVVNDILHTNFNDLINQYRIDAFKEKILRPDSRKYSIAGLAQDMGFSSKASFYRAFKKETGQTPTDYIKQSEKRSQIKS
jgi:AraC-like DNA-binding protein